MARGFDQPSTMAYDTIPLVPPVSDNAPLVPGVANSVAIALFDEHKDIVRKSPIRKFMSKFKSKSPTHGSSKPVLINLHLHEYSARGWDIRNNRWRNTVWPTLDEDFVEARGRSVAWNLVQLSRDDPTPLDRGQVPDETVVTPHLPATDAMGKGKGQEHNPAVLDDPMTTSLEGKLEPHDQLILKHLPSVGVQDSGTDSSNTGLVAGSSGTDVGSSTSDFVGHDTTSIPVTLVIQDYRERLHSGTDSGKDGTQPKMLVR